MAIIDQFGRKSPSGLGQAVNVAWWSPLNASLFPFRSKEALIFQSGQHGVKRAGLDSSDLHYLISMHTSCGIEKCRQGQLRCFRR